MNQGTKSGMKLDDAALIDELRRHSVEAAKRYLEHVVVSKKSPNKKLHRELLDNLFHEAEEQLANDGVKYHLEELGELNIAHVCLATDQDCRFRVSLEVRLPTLLCLSRRGRAENANQVDSSEAVTIYPRFTLL
jgi:hypothetical protein